MRSVRAFLFTVLVAYSGSAAAQVEWEVFEGNPVIPPPEQGSWDDQGRWVDAVVKVNGVYHLFFNGTATQVLHDHAIGHAISSDGITWEMDPNNPVLTPETEGSWQVTSLLGAAVIHDGEQFRMWYGGGTVTGSVLNHQVGYATSPDGSTWTRHPGNPVIERGPAGSFDAGWLLPGSVVDDGGLLKMWYTAANAPSIGVPESIAYATSTDGVHWAKHPSPVLDSEEDWESFAADFPCVVYDGTSYHMWYVGYQAVGGIVMHIRIGYAASPDGIEWTKDAGNPIEELGDWVSQPVVLRDGLARTYEMFYSKELVYSVLRATSEFADGESALLVVPAAAYAAGAEGAFFQTDLDVNNTAPSESGLTASYQLLWLPRGEDNSVPMTSDVFELPAGESVRYANVLSEVFGIEPDAVGALGIATDSTGLIGMSRTYNVPVGKLAGTFGQALPAIPTTEMQTAGDTRRLIFLSQDDDFRANVGCVNGTDRPVSINLVLRDEAGFTLDTQTMNLDPWSNDQVNRILRDHAPVDGYVDVSSDTPDAAFYCYGSMLDNLTSDPTTILPQRPSAATLNVVPAAALASGSEGSFFQTDVDLNNAGFGLTSYTFQWLPRGEDNSTPITSEMYMLDVGMSVRYENVLAEVFGAEPDALGALALSVDFGNILVMSRTYNIPTAKVAGTFGQALAGVPLDEMQGPGEARRIIFLSENDDVRANVGCVNATGHEISIDIELHDSEGNRLATRHMDLAPWSSDQVNRIFRAFAPVNGYVDVSSASDGAAFYCYGSVLDNFTNDPTTIPPQ